MPRAYRYYMRESVWHITHRCHKREYLLKFQRDRERWKHWLFTAKKRYGLCVLNYCITSNHIHLLVLDKGRQEIAQSMQLIEGRVAQEYNTRKKREGAFWEDRYHATAVDTGIHALRCSRYIDFNMVRAGVVKHPSEWQDSGFEEIMKERKRYRIIDRCSLANVLELSQASELSEMYKERTEYLYNQMAEHREAMWTESIAVGSETFVKKMSKTIKTWRRQRKMKIKENGTALLV